MSLFGLLGIARDGTAAQSAALTTTGSNVANVSTPGYTRRTALLTTSLAGGSVTYVKTQRNFDQFAFGKVIDEAGKNSAATARSGALDEVETAMAPPTNSIGDDATLLVKSFNALAGAPTDPSLRTDVVEKAKDLATNIQNTRASLESTSQDIVSQASDVLTNLNAQLKQISDLNTQIATTEGSGGDASALRDQRDVSVRTVGEAIGAKAIEDKNGQVTLYAAGSVLVEGNHANPVSMQLDPSTGNMQFFANGGTKADITAQVTTGTLGGLKEARDTDVKQTIANLDSYAYDVANAFNTVHAAGYGTDGSTGNNLFTISSTQAGAAATMTLNPTLDGHPEKVAAADASGNLPGGNVVALQLANLSDTPSFGGTTLTDCFAAMATDVGFRKQNADNDVTLRTNTLASAQTLSDSANGVSIDEEMVNLTQYQRAFEASAKVMKTADDLLQSLMDLSMRVTERSRLDGVLLSQNQASQRLDKASRIASSGQQVTKPSDDPVAYGTMVRRDYAVAMLDQRAATSSRAQSELEVAGNALDSATDLMTKIQDTAAQGANATSDSNGRKLLAEDVRTMKQELLSIANTKYADKYLFAGTKTDSQPFDTTTNAFSGNDQTVRVPVLDGVTPPANVSGAKAFTTAGGRDIFGDLDALATALDNNDQAGVQSQLSNLQAGHDQIVRSQTEAGYASERFSTANDVLTNTKATVVARLNAEVDGDPTAQLTELTLARTAYERSVAVTKQLLSINLGS